MRVLTFIFLFSGIAGFAQQDAIFSQYMFNPFAINPAYAGSRDAISVVLINRSQWLGIAGAPNTQTLSAHVPMNRNNMAWGVNFSHDKVGPTNNILASATAAYRLILEKGTLTFGLRGGVFNTVIDHGKLNFREEGDQLDSKEKISSLVPTFDFGLYYYTEKMYLGLSGNHLTEHRFELASYVSTEDYFLRRHIFLAGGYVFETKRNVLFKPSALIKYTPNSPINVDVNLNVMFNKLFWVGVGVRNLSSTTFLFDFNITDYLRIGYSYDLTLNKIKNYMNGSHEILLGFDFNVKKVATASPRYL